MLTLRSRTHRLAIASWVAFGVVALTAGLLIPTAQFLALFVFCMFSFLIVLVVVIDLRTQVLHQKAIFKSHTREMFDNSFSQTEAILRLSQMVNGFPALPPTRHWAASPDFLVHLYEQIEAQRPKTIVEFGSGLTTLISAIALRNLDYKAVIHSVEHSSAYLEIAQENLVRFGLEEFVVFHHSDLVEMQFNGVNFTWYDTVFVNELSDVDLVVVDGPPLSVGRRARYPALPVLFSKFSPVTCVILDDADRDDEKLVVDAWLNEYPNLQRTELVAEKGCVLLRCQ